MNNNDVAAIATGGTEGSISVIRVSGENAIKIANKVFVSNFNKSLENMKGYTATLGKIYKDRKMIDEVIALVFRAPNSYTGENVVELSCHGGIFVTNKVLETILEAGAKIAEPGEFTKRAFLNNKMNLTTAENVMDLILAKNEQSLNAALRAKEGQIFKKISKIKEDLLSLAANFSASLDYDFEEIESLDEKKLLKKLQEVKKELEALISNFNRGKIINKGLRTVIIGRPNVGKSTLMNLLSGFDRSIITNIEGTTRDTVEETINLGSIALRIIDTAGIRKTEDIIEKIGVKKSLKELELADFVLAVFDSSKSLCSEDLEILENLKKKISIVILNKIDLDVKIEKEKVYSLLGENVLELSLKKKKSLDVIEKKILKVLNLSKFDQNEDFLANKRQLLCAKFSFKKIKEAIDLLKNRYSFDLIFLKIEEAIEKICELIGEKISETLVDKIFSEFCVGK